MNAFVLAAAFLLPGGTPEDILVAQSPARVKSCNCAETGICTCQGECQCPDCPPDCPCRLKYKQALARAMAQSRPMVVSVGNIPILKVAGAICCRAEALPGCPQNCVLIGVPGGDGIIYAVKTFTHRPTAEQCQATIDNGIPAPTQTYQPSYSTYQNSAPTYSQAYYSYPSYSPSCSYGYSGGGFGGYSGGFGGSGSFSGGGCSGGS